MKRRCIDLRIWLPAIVAAAGFSVRALPDAPLPALPKSRSISLPQLYGAPLRARAQHYELVAEKSSVRFQVAGTGRQLLTECHGITGSLHFGPTAQDGSIELNLDLATLQAVTPQPATLDTAQVLGILGDLEVAYHGKLVATTTSDLPGIAQCSWLGRIHFGPRILAQSMQLWRCSLPGRLLRLQGHGKVSGELIGLPNRISLGLFDSDFQITLGLDLAWRRLRD